MEGGNVLEVFALNEFHLFQLSYSAGMRRNPLVGALTQLFPITIRKKALKSWLLMG
jgi:hypothetical protein